ncbi:MAG: potassium transporter TrkG, partial [Bacteroidales bacterium]
MKPFNWKFVIFIIGILLIIESAFLLISTIVALYYGDHDVRAFIISLLLTLATGGLSLWTCHNHDKDLHRREGYFIVAFSWIALSLFGMLPFILSGSIPSVTNAFFETMSGFTTTGASILNDIDSLPHGILFWRSIIQWLGGMGVIVFTLAILPRLGVAGGVQ